MLSHYKPLSALDSTYYLRDTVGNDAEVVIPQCYREGFFSKDSLYHAELSGGRCGTAGDPVPYTMKNDLSERDETGNWTVNKAQFTYWEKNQRTQIVAVNQTRVISYWDE